MADRFEIREKAYPMPQTFRLCDPVLVEELTGLPFHEFAERLDAAGESANGDGDGVDPVLMPGLVGVAVWQTNRTWKREKVIRFVQQIDIEEVQLLSDSLESEERPPAESSSTSSSTSTKPAEESL